MSDYDKRAREITSRLWDLLTDGGGWNHVKVQRFIEGELAALSAPTPAPVASDFPERSKWDAPDQFSPDDQSRAWAAGWNDARQHAMSIIKAALSTPTPAPVAGDQEVTRDVDQIIGDALKDGRWSEAVSRIVGLVNAARAEEREKILSPTSIGSFAEAMSRLAEIKDKMYPAFSPLADGLRVVLEQLRQRYVPDRGEPDNAIAQDFMHWFDDVIGVQDKEKRDKVLRAVAAVAAKIRAEAARPFVEAGLENKIATLLRKNAGLELLIYDNDGENYGVRLLDTNTNGPAKCIQRRISFDLPFVIDSFISALAARGGER